MIPAELARRTVPSLLRPWAAAAVIAFGGFVAACAPVLPATDGVDPPSHHAPAPRAAQERAPARARVRTDPPEIDLSAHSTRDPASLWVVVNKRAPLDPVDFTPELTTVRGYLVQPIVAEDLVAMLEVAERDGVHLTLRSAFRSHDYQARVFDGWVDQLGRDEATKVSAPPGHSEHQTGLAVDLGSSTRPDCDFSACFADTVEGRWIAAHATQFGFLLRYTPDVVDITGYAPEGWHLRYVGHDLAEYMARHSIRTLEEVFGVQGGSLGA